MKVFFAIFGLLLISYQCLAAEERLIAPRCPGNHIRIRNNFGKNNYIPKTYSSCRSGRGTPIQSLPLPSIPVRSVPVVSYPAASVPVPISTAAASVSRSYPDGPCYGYKD